MRIDLKGPSVLKAIGEVGAHVSFLLLLFVLCFISLSLKKIENEISLNVCLTCTKLAKLVAMAIPSWKHQFS